MPSTDNEQKIKLLQLMQTALQQDQILRDQYQIGDKFRFIRDRLFALHKQIEETLSEFQQTIQHKKNEIAEDEMLVYVYLFNAQGVITKTWQKMLTPSVFYEYSVNRPIYLEQSAIESYIRSKKNKLQHGYFSIIIKKSDVIATPPLLPSPKDVIGNPIIKVREGSLDFMKFVSFTHHGHDYVLDETGALVKREE